MSYSPDSHLHYFTPFTVVRFLLTCSRRSFKAIIIVAAVRYYTKQNTHRNQSSPPPTNLYLRERTCSLDCIFCETIFFFSSRIEYVAFWHILSITFQRPFLTKVVKCIGLFCVAFFFFTLSSTFANSIFLLLIFLVLIKPIITVNLTGRFA